MGRIAITQERYDKMAKAFREAPGNARRCARAAGVNPRTARKAWEHGWPEFKFPAIKDLLRDEQTAARARLAESRAAELKQINEKQAAAAYQDAALARTDSIDSLAEETKMVRAARHTAMGLQAVMHRLLRGTAKLTERMEEEIATMDLKKPKELVLILKELATMVRQTNEASRLAQQMEHSLVGKPDQWIGISSSVTTEEAAAEVAAAQRALDRLKKKGRVVEVIDVQSDDE